MDASIAEHVSPLLLVHCGFKLSTITFNSAFLFSGFNYLSHVFLQIYLHQLADTCGSDVLPSSVLHVLKSKACRSAVMFGDHLSTSKCTALLQQLSKTRQWRQCAHGRPTSAVLANMPALREAVLVRKRARQTVTELAGAHAGAERPASLHEKAMHLTELTEDTAGVPTYNMPGGFVQNSSSSHRPQALTVTHLRSVLAQRVAKEARRLAVVTRRQQKAKS